MPPERSSADVPLEQLVHDLRGSLNTLGTTLALAELRARHEPELLATLGVAQRSFEETRQLLERLVAATRVPADDSRPA
ncbi:MAG: hypothetical protein RLW61_04780 [Gammaproteobacteria bacterium]